MARLSDADVDRLVVSLSGVSDSSPAGQSASEPQATPLPPGRLQKAQQELLRLSEDGSLGPLLTQRLAAYLNRPVRCSSGDPLQLADDNVLYIAPGGGVRFWLRIDAAAVSAIADAMIGGEGDGPKVGFGPKVLRVAEAALREMMRGMSSLLQLDDPGPATVDPSRDRNRPVLACGRLSMTTQAYGWQAGVVAAEAIPEPRSAPAVPVASATFGAASSASGVAAAQRGSGLEPALEAARDRLQQILRCPVAFDAVTIERLESAQIPQGWLRISLASRSGGAVVLSVDREAAVGLVNCALGADVIDPASGGELVESGAEVILQAALHGFAGALPDRPDRLHHMMLLTDEAILAELPHYSVVNRFEARRHSGALCWLIPENMLRPRGTAARLTREKVS